MNYPPPVQAAARPIAPRSIHVAVYLMYAGAAVSVISMIAWLAASGSVKTGVEEANRALTPGQVGTVMGLYDATAVVIGIITAALWLWMAWKTSSGRGWARILSTVLFALYLLPSIAAAARFTMHYTVNGTSASVPAPAAGKLTMWLIVLVGAATIIALWQRQSSAYFAATKQHGAIQAAGGYGPTQHEQQPYGAPPGPTPYGPTSSAEPGYPPQPPPGTQQPPGH